MAAIKYFRSMSDEISVPPEFFNLLNTVNFTVPGLSSTNPNESAAGNIVRTGSFGKLTPASQDNVGEGMFERHHEYPEFGNGNRDLASALQRPK